MITIAKEGRSDRAFTVIELLIVMSIIIVLTGLIIGTSGYVQKKGARSRAEAEIAAMSAALESYKADNGIYPTSTDTSGLDPANPAINQYNNASKFLYGQLSGDVNGDGVVDNQDKANPSDPLPKTYMQFKPATMQRANMSQPVSASNPVTATRDPFGNPYGYSTAKSANPTATVGYNPTFDLWSVSDGSAGGNQSQWIKNW